MEKEEAARVEKHAQAHLDKAQSISASATKIALAWVVALVLLWTQKLEPKLKDIRTARQADHSLITAKARDNPFEKLQDQYDEAVRIAKEDDIELPFSIKFKTPPEWTATLWLTLSFGLVSYMLWVRLSAMSLAKRGIQLLKHAGSEPPFIRAVVGGMVWWIAPLSSAARRNGIDEELRRALGMDSIRLGLANALVLASACALIVVELRVCYIGLSITAFQIVTSAFSVSQVLKWWGFIILNSLLCCGLFMMVALWFLRNPEIRTPETETNCPLSRREAMRLFAASGVVAGSCILSLSASTFAFGRKNLPKNAATQNKTAGHEGQGPKRIRKRRESSNTPLSAGLYQNNRTGVVHTASPHCKTCLRGAAVVALRTIDPSNVMRSAKIIASSKPILESVQANEVPSKASLVQRFHTRHKVFILESCALDLIRDNKAADACELLWGALQEETYPSFKRNMRLYDLVAGLAVRFQKKDVLNSLIQRFENMSRPGSSPSLFLRFSSPLLELAGGRGLPSDLSNQTDGMRVSRKRRHHHKLEAHRTHGQNHSERLRKLMLDRMKKWQNTHSDWYKKWQDKSKPVKWPRKDGVEIL